MKNALYCTILMAWLLQACTKPECCPRYFQIPFEVIPLQSVYHVGDTITVQSKFHRQVTAFNGEQKELGTFDMANILWQPLSVVNRIDTIAHPGMPTFSVIDENFLFLYDSTIDYNIFQSSTSGKSLTGEFNYQKDSFYLSYKLVCNTPGTFLLLNISLDVAGHGLQQDFPGKCGRDGFDVWSKMNGGMNNNFEFLKESPDEHWNDWLVKQEEHNKTFSKLGYFCFKVAP